MNKNYVYVDGNAIISDDEGNQKVIKYHDNLDEVLAKENVVESIEDKIEELEEMKSTETGYIGKHYFPALSITTLILTGIISIILGLEMDLAIITLLFLAMMGLTPAIFFDCHNYEKYKNLKKRRNGLAASIEYLKKQLEKEKQEFEDLSKNNKHKHNQVLERYKVVEIDDKHQLEDLEKYLTLYYVLAYDSDMYYRYYKKDRLDEKLSRYYNHEDIEKAEEYLEEKGPTLSKKKNK